MVQILVEEKLQNLSATARKHLFAIVQSIVIHSESFLGSLISARLAALCTGPVIWAFGRPVTGKQLFRPIGNGYFRGKATATLPMLVG